MSDQPHEAKREHSSPEEESKAASKEAHRFTTQALKRTDEAQIAKLALDREKAIKAQHSLVEDAKHTRDRNIAMREQAHAQMRSVSERRKHLEAAADAATKEATDAAKKQQAANLALEEANALKTAADAEATLKAADAAAALAAETKLRAQIADLDTAEETFAMAEANSEATVAQARATYASEVAKIRKAAADRDMTGA
jgi:colicin import membrane protein